MNALLFIALPYVALVLAIGVGIYRKLRKPYTYSSLSSEILENKRLFWGSVPFHYGITLILLAHLLAALFPSAAGWLLGGEIRRLVLELTGIALGIYTLFGLIVLIARRLVPKSLAQSVTSHMDGIVLFVLLVQVASGVGVAIFNRWGGVWYLHTAVPWFWSLAVLNPDTSTVDSLPALVKVHFVTGFVLILLFPFSRLVHLVMFPLQYLWRPYQVVIWNHRRATQGSVRREIAR
ncbi:MAG: respiratory nitrate reductase subunit gamma [Bryobacteraceae bacterium]|nr:respiratory nitrate reductase subunit gamma [Bryobacterales bacterium]MEB2361745.1 respiratory nitrate reductase subunit gamma [Bryobacterales bacterium]NUN01014.1 respiratory nitrate reductase subunit gamma [Bryobacteraceae bacterium]